MAESRSKEKQRLRQEAAQRGAMLGSQESAGGQDPFKIDRGDAPTGRGGNATLSQEALVGAQTVQDAARGLGKEGRIIGSKPVQKVAGFADKLNKIKAPQIVGNLAKGSRLAQAGSLLTPAGIYTAADLITGVVRDDGRGLSEMGGDAIGGAVGNMMLRAGGYERGDGYGDNEGMRTLSEENERREAAGEAAMSAPESVAFLNSMNPNQFDATNARLDAQEGIQTPQSLQAAPEGSIVGSFQDPGGQNIGMFQGQPNAPINQQQLDSMAGQMVDTGASFISGGLTDASGQTIPGAAGRPEGMNPFIDQSGNVAFADPDTANRMNALAGQEAQENAAAQQRAIQSIASRGQVPQEAQQGSPQANFIERMKTAEENPLNKQEIDQGEAMARSMGTTFNPETGYSRDAFLNGREKSQSSSGRSGGSAFSKASLDREARIDARPDFNDALSDRDRRADRGEGTSMADLVDIAKGNAKGASPRDVARGSKVAEDLGINPLTGNKVADEEDDRRRQADFDDARIASLEQEDPTKLQEVQSQVDALLDGYSGQAGDDMTEKERDDLRRQMIFKLLNPNADIIDNPFAPQT
tara:strand:+ start:4927 stop:6675 length:1749 start_codon:yes stop_codon:yes gene_type:complete